MEIAEGFLVVQASTTAKMGMKKAKEQITVDRRPNASNLRLRGGFFVVAFIVAAAAAASLVVILNLLVFFLYFFLVTVYVFVVAIV